MRVAVVAVAAGLLLTIMSAVPAAAYEPYHTTSYSAKPAAGVPGNLDITKVTYGFNGTYVRFTMSLSQAGAAISLPYTQAIYNWRFSYDNLQVVVEYNAYANQAIFGALGAVDGALGDPDYVGITQAGVDNTNLCTACYGHIDVRKNELDFYDTPDDITANIGVVDPTAPTLKKGTVLHLIEADTDTAILTSLVTTFPQDSAPAPKGKTFKL